jgi:hypothetical protein
MAIKTMKAEDFIQKTTDSFTNVLARLGANTPNLMEGTQYPLTRLTQNYQLMNSLYRSHWIARRIIDVIPEDMCKNWFKITSQLPPDQLERFDKLQRIAQVKKKILLGLKWGRLYGGAGGIIMIQGHENMLDQPLNFDEIYPDSFKGLLIVDRWSGLYPMLELVEDINDPEFGLPDMYQVTSQAIGGTIKIHHSRLLRFIGRELPYWEEQAEIHWGASEIEHIYDELKKRDNTSWNIANLTFLANLRVLKMEGMGQMLATGNDKVQTQLYETMQAQNWLMSNMGMYILGEKDDFATHQYSFAGLSDIYENFMMDLAGAAEIPVTRLFGRSPAGLNATGESDLQSYYETIQQKQAASLGPVIDKLLPIMCMSEFGMIPDDLDYKFNPVATPSDKDKVELGSKYTTAIVDTFQSGLISQQTSLKELREMSEVTGMWSNITDEDIANADITTGQAGEDSQALLDQMSSEVGLNNNIIEGGDISESTPSVN